MPMVFALHPDCTPDHVGLIPSFLDENDQRPATEQFAEKYIGGWHAQEKFTMTKGAVLHYPGDPPMAPLAMILFRNERIFIYEYGYVCVTRKDGSFETCRMD